MLTFGFPPSDPESENRAYTAELAVHLDERSGLPMQPRFSTDYRALVDDLVAGRLDAAWLPPLNLLRADTSVRPVLALQRAGKSSYHGAIVARRDSGLVGLRDLAGKRMGWVDKDSAGGYVLARALIAEQYRDVDAFLGPQEFCGSHRAVVEAVRDGKVDAGATFVHFGRDFAVTSSGWQEFLGERAHELGSIALTGSIPSDVIAVRNELPEDDGAALVEALLGLASDPDGRVLLAKVFNANGLEEPRMREYEQLAILAERAGWRP